MSNNPGSQGGYDNELQASAHASGIELVRDDVEASILRLEMDEGRVEWVVFNPRGTSLETDSFKTDERFTYIPASETLPRAD